MRSAGVIGFFFSSMPVGGTMAWASSKNPSALAVPAIAWAVVITPIAKPIAVKRLIMPRFLRSKTPREFVKRCGLRRIFRNPTVRRRAGGKERRRGSFLMSAPPVKSNTRQEHRLHPLPVRVMHWTNAVAIFIMIGSGWKIYNDDALFGFLHFPDAIVIGKWAQYGLQWHFFGMWIFVINGLAYLIYGIATGRFRQKLFPLSLREILATVGDALRFRLAHEDLTHYNAVQKILYLGIVAVGVLIVISGFALWKPVQFSELASLFGSFQTIRLVHFLCMAAIVGFLLIHVTLALLVPKSLVAMLTGGPAVDDKPAAADAAAEATP
jgi:thiosulfate reductase cytochrome b subunit